MMSPRYAAWLGIVLMLPIIGCEEDFDPPTLVTRLRVLGISADPPDLIPGQAVVLSALVTTPEGMDGIGMEGIGMEGIEYEWEWCPLNAGPNEAYECLDQGLGVPEEFANFFDLGTASTAVLPYALDGETLRQICLDAVAGLEGLSDFAEIPTCEDGFELTIRLTVRLGEQEKVAIRKVFLWFDTPEALQTNQNPAILGIQAGGVDVTETDLIAIAPGGAIKFDVVVDPASSETFVPRSEAGGTEARTEDILYSFFSTQGEWDRQRTYADNENVTFAEAGVNELSIESDVAEDSTIEVFFVIRDGRGGVSWTTRSLRVLRPQ